MLPCRRRKRSRRACSVLVRVFNLVFGRYASGDSVPTRPVSDRASDTHPVSLSGQMFHRSDTNGTDGTVLEEFFGIDDSEGRHGASRRSCKRLDTPANATVVEDTQSGCGPWSVTYPCAALSRGEPRCGRRPRLRPRRLRERGRLPRPGSAGLRTWRGR